MDSTDFKNLLITPENLKGNQISELKSIIRDYPYFQSSRALYLKGLKNQESFRYNNELKLTAAYTNDRSVLFDFITSKSFEQNTDIHQQISDKISKQETLQSEEKEAPPVEAKLELGKPINFSFNETHSFQEWLQLSSHKPIVRNVKEEKKPVSKEFLIDRFIETNPKIKTINKEDKVNISISKNKTNKSLMTETLAKVYLEQKKFSNAIKAYEILSLKYPEKSGFFADQIKKIKILQKNKS